jgi:acyl-CoA thioesterase-2
MMAPDDIAAMVHLRETGPDLFAGRSPRVGWQRVYGGLVIAQALAAALRTVPQGRGPHALHALFLRPGDPDADIAYRVERLRDGGSFSARRVEARQHGQTILSALVSFQRGEEGAFAHAAAMPDVPAPESLPDEAELLARFARDMPENMRAYFSRPRPVTLRFCEPERLLEPRRLSRGSRSEGGMPAQHVWIRASRQLPDDPALHACTLAYASDMTLLDTALVPHGRNIFDRTLMMASLDHALWMFRPFRADEWLLFAQESPSMHAGRGYTRGLVFSRNGTLVAATAQEGLIRPARRPAPPEASRW